MPHERRPAARRHSHRSARHGGGPVSDGYLLLKTLHLLSAAVLLGTGAGIAFFTWFGSRQALRSGSIEALRTILRLTVRADWVFTAVAVVVQPVSGALLMRQMGASFGSAWFQQVAALFVAVGACWLPVVWLQYRLRDEALRCASVAQLSAGFHRRFRLWFLLGIPAFAMVLGLYWLMVAKPGWAA